MTAQVVLVFVVIVVTCVSAKVYDRCELARELKTQHKIPEEQIATWVCIARHESEYNTSAVGHRNADGSGDHGLFQISDLYWCSPPGVGWACGVDCSQLHDADLKDDVACAKRIYRQHQRLAGDGFTAWAVYRHHCSVNQVSQYVEGCFDAAPTTEESKVNNEVVISEDKEKENANNEVVISEDKEKENANNEVVISKDKEKENANKGEVKHDKAVAQEEHEEGLLQVMVNKLEEVDRVTTDSTEDSTVGTDSTGGLVKDVKENLFRTVNRNSGIIAKPKTEEVIQTERKYEEPKQMKPNSKPFNRYYAKLYEFRST